MSDNNLLFDPSWEQAEKIVDPDFEGSIWEILEFDPEICPTCKSHLKDGICLNGCHLCEISRKKFLETLKSHA